MTAFIEHFRMKYRWDRNKITITEMVIRTLPAMMTGGCPRFLFLGNGH